MKKSVAIKIMVLFLTVFCIVLLPISQAEPPIKILTAYATSASADSTPVTALLDVTEEGSWKPQTKDSGTNEGIFFQFTAPVLIDWIEVKAKGGAKQCYLDFYLDGKRNVTNREKKEDADFESNQVEYSVSLKDTGKDRVFYLGAKGGYDSAHDFAYLNAKVKAVFIKISSAASVPQITSVRLFRKDNKNPLSVALPPSITGKVTASSTLAPETAYGCQNLFDAKTDFAWATNGKQTSGIGETVTIELDKQQDLSGLTIWNGYQRSETHYLANARPSKLAVTINGDTEVSLTVSDKMDAQELRFPKVFSEVKTLSIKITGVYSGTKYKDMVVSELKLMDKNGDPMLFSLPSVKINLPDKELEKLFDISLAPCMLGILRTENKNEQYYSSEFDNAYNYPHRSIRLRSNGSFVGYFEDGFIAEGNWESLSDGFRIFGKKYVTYSDDSIYMRSGNQNSETKIFQDPIKIIYLANTPYSEVKKYLKTLLAERDYSRIIAENPGPVFWWMGVKPYREVKLTGKNEEELLKACYEKAVALKAYLLVSPMFIDLFLPENILVQVDVFYG